MLEEITALGTLIIAALVGYLFGAIPVAHLVSRRRHIDIFSIGTGQAGTTNVFRNVGHLSGVVVLAGDVAKGSLAIVVANLMGVHDLWLLLPGAASIAGHWRSIFTGFRGGDGLATLIGVTIALMPFYGFISLFLGFAISRLFRHTAHPSIWGGVFSFVLLVFLSFTKSEVPFLGVGIVMLALMVLAHSAVGHRRRSESPE